MAPAPLIWAVYRADYDVAEALIAKKAEVNVTNEFGATPLTEAARLSDGVWSRCCWMPARGSESANPDGETALMMAIRERRIARRPDCWSKPART